MIRTDAPHTTAALTTTNPDADATFTAALPWVRAEAEQLARRLPPSAEYDADELFQVGAIAAWKLAREWDASRALFESFAKLRVHGEMIDHIRNGSACGFGHASARRRTRDGEPIRVVSFAAEAKSGEYGERTTVGDQVGECDAEITDDAAVEIAAIVRRESGGASRDEQVAAGLYFGAGEPMRVVGEKLGLSESRVSQVIGGVVERIRDRLVSRGRTRYTAFA